MTVRLAVPLTVTVADARALPVVESVTVPLNVNVGGAGTVIVSTPVLPPYAAAMSVDPDINAVTMPPDATVATLLFDEDHTALDVTVAVEPSARTASEVNCDELPTDGGVPTTVTDRA